MKPVVASHRYHILDGLRGVAAVLVILYHFGEAFAVNPVTQFMNHGYLAVDFFFVLSGFVLGYAYDKPMASGRLTSGGFMLRRVIRLHPMVVLSVLLGAIAYLIQGSVRWDGTPVPPHMLAGALVLGLVLIPVLPFSGTDVRGNGEMFPLNGPSWSLFFEYIGSILYAFWLHRLGKRALWVVVVLSGAGLMAVLLGNMSGFYHLGMGWSLADCGFLGGFLRLSFSFSAGLLLSRSIKPRRVRGSFWICTAVIVALFSCPYVTADGEPSVLNALYDGVCTLFIFPALVWLGACGQTTDSFSTATCDKLGRLSYPVYIVHYPLMYLFYAWVWNNGYSFSHAWPVCVAIFVAVIILAWISLRCYDEPVRAYLTRRFVKKQRS
ncbi:MAG: acyltransferase [Muribaculaceae bacterium]|nr:acyltransferase [Muribaculaceae bacterium]